MKTSEKQKAEAAKRRIVVGGRYMLNRFNRTTDGGWGPVEVVGPNGDWLTQVRDLLGGDEYPCDPCDLRTIPAAAESLLPARSGQVREFRAHGNTFRLKRHKYQEYSLFQDGVTTRSRWGTKAQILEDVSHVLEFGTLPPPSGPRW